MLKIQLNNSNHRRIEFTEKSSHSPLNNNGRRSNLVKTINYLVQRKF